MSAYNDVPTRDEIKVGSKVKLIQKKDYESGKITEGVVKEILTSKNNHPRGIKVKLTNGIVGRVQALGDQPVTPVQMQEDLPVIDYQLDEDDLL